MREIAKSFTELIVRQRAHTFVLTIYKLTQQFPREEQFGLTSQLRRAAVSIPASTAEDIRRRSDKDKVRFYINAQASFEECGYYLILTQDLDYGDIRILHDRLSETSRLPNRYIKSIVS
jgi:four helix bundle protein